MRAVFGLWAAAVLACAPGVSAAQGPAWFGVRIGGDEIKVPAPAGYCEPMGRWANLAAATDAADSQSITYLALVDCAGQASSKPLPRSLFLRAPKAMMAERLTVAQLLERLGPVPESELNLALSSGPAVGRARADLERALGKAEVEGVLRPIGRDAHGFYIGGLMKLEVGGRRGQTAVAVGFTTVKGHVVAIASYVSGSNLAALRAALDVAKAEAAALIEANS